MGAPYGNIEEKVEDAFKAVIEAQFADNLAGVQFVTGFSAVEKTVPRVEVYCPRAVPEYEGDIFLGNWRVEVAVVVVTNYGDTSRDERKGMAGELFDAILDSEFIGWLNIAAVPDFHAYGGVEGEGEGFTPVEVTREPVDHSFVRALMGTLYCRPST